jgi:hypothetical protein
MDANEFLTVCDLKVLCEYNAATEAKVQEIFLVLLQARLQK